MSPMMARGCRKVEGVDLADVAGPVDQEDLEHVRELRRTGRPDESIHRVLHVLPETLDQWQQLADGGRGEEEPAQPAFVFELAAGVALHDGGRVPRRDRSSR